MTVATEDVIVLLFKMETDFSKTTGIFENWVILCNKLAGFLCKRTLQGPNAFLFLSSQIPASTEMHGNGAQSRVDFNMAAQI